MSRPAVSCHGVTVAYDREPAIEDVSFTLAVGTCTGLVGPNGAGKSTLLNAIMRLVSARSGEIEILGEPGRPGLRHVAYVPQRGTVDWDFPVTVRDVVRQGLYRELGPFRRLRTTHRERIDRALDQVQIRDLEERQIGELSGGQQQRVFLARALVQDAPIYLMDEPFAGVDAATERAIIGVLRTLQEANRTVLVVHHDLATVTEYFDHLILLRQRVVASGRTEEVFTDELLTETYGGRVTVIGAHSLTGA